MVRAFPLRTHGESAQGRIQAGAGLFKQPPFVLLLRIGLDLPGHHGDFQNGPNGREKKARQLY